MSKIVLRIVVDMVDILRVNPSATINDGFLYNGGSGLIGITSRLKYAKVFSSPEEAFAEREFLKRMFIGDPYRTMLLEHARVMDAMSGDYYNEFSDQLKSDKSPSAKPSRPPRRNFNHALAALSDYKAEHSGFALTSPDEEGMVVKQRDEGVDIVIDGSIFTFTGINDLRLFADALNAFADEIGE